MTANSESNEEPNNIFVAAQKFLFVSLSPDEVNSKELHLTSLTG